MRKFRLIQSLYFLPVFFFTLAGSPNIVGWRIGLVLVSVFILLIPATNYLVVNAGKRGLSSGEISYSFVDFLSLLMLMVALYLGWQIGWQFNLLQTLYLTISVSLISHRDYSKAVNNIKWFISRGSVGVVLYALIYIGLNQYDFNNLLRIHITLIASLSTLLFVTILFASNLRSNYMLKMDDLGTLLKVQLKPVKQFLILISIILLAFETLFITTYKWIYALYFVMALLPAYATAILLLSHVKTNNSARIAVTSRILNFVLTAGLVIFFLYFFLDSTQVLQAIRGGY